MFTIFFIAIWVSITSSYFSVILDGLPQCTIKRSEKTSSQARNFDVASSSTSIMLISSMRGSKGYRVVIILSVFSSSLLICFCLTLTHTGHCAIYAYWFSPRVYQPEQQLYTQLFTWSGVGHLRARLGVRPLSRTEWDSQRSEHRADLPQAVGLGEDNQRHPSPLWPKARSISVEKCAQQFYTILRAIEAHCHMTL